MDIILGVFVLTFTVSILVLAILFARSKLIISGEVTIAVNGNLSRSFVTTPGKKLLAAMADKGIFISSACGGSGTCGQCRIKVKSGGGAILPTELNHITKKRANHGERLACQVSVKSNMDIELPEEIFGTKKWECTVISNDNKATFIKELVLKIPEGEKIEFQAGGYIQIESEPHHVKYSDFDIPEIYRSDWEKLGLFRYESIFNKKIVRAYSMASYPEEKNLIKLNVRIAIPPSFQDLSIPPGIMSSYIWSLKVGDKCMISGPFGHFFAKDTDNEMIFIGGGAGMAPMRSHIFDQLLRLKSKRKITYWYGARSKREMFYIEEFDDLQDKNDNFSWHVALSNPLPEDNWDGYTGFIHEVIYENYLKYHETPEDCEYYMCGPPMMNNAVIRMLQDLGVEDENILLDDFGG
ncbi:Na(+)-translocating NADH-quinone reductase subunit F [Candidatus Photodesmus katoptron]|uniref:Na(+)-translocating NADH-quinone reductase subunit F n=1 Tax=Candidatus Photodesmus katoptron Akat1 TaxID=1236703 RepID=S3EI82_9GAMM|nr:NADH:ubiquinone reductase (Na(+)-transporting) subunit F [Candidatus Photodesmus katoptron]EPE37888.1 NADH:ubiquinone oxidoreductase, Na(+)-translocating, F subunit [Candidatus Photodesmus katoptron Akat1]KEY90392.1 Na(+)-translocating NADH-quinone reductase subunit F [Candidatus Photodesmus katoptron]